MEKSIRDFLVEESGTSARYHCTSVRSIDEPVDALAGNGRVSWVSDASFPSMMADAVNLYSRNQVG